MMIVDIEKYETYIRVRLATNFKEMASIEEWCRTTQCGKKVNRHSFAFKTDGEFLMFKLRWM